MQPTGSAQPEAVGEKILTHLARTLPLQKAHRKRSLGPDNHSAGALWKNSRTLQSGQKLPLRMEQIVFFE